MMTSRSQLWVILFPLLLGLSASAKEQKPPTLLEVLTPSANPINEAAMLLFSGDVLQMETPIAVRYVLITILAPYTVQAACHPTALSFFGKKDPILPRLCRPTPRIVISSYITYRLLASQFPLEAAPFAAFLQRVGLTPFSRSTDQTTTVGWANAVSNDLIAYLETDGWNSLGDLTRAHYRQQYADTTGYKPQNHADLDPTSLRRPLRWQPLTQAADNRGRFAAQVHVVPHVGLRAKPLVLSQRQLAEKRAPPPYVTPNRPDQISKRDEKEMRRLIKELFRRNRALTAKQVALAHWWDSKFFSLGNFIGVYQGLLKFDVETLVVMALGEMMAQHDAVLVAWKEKVRHDLVRPPTMIRRLLRGAKVRAFKNLQEGVGVVKAEEWEPILKTQPHSEYPSASALICRASMDHLRAALMDVVGVNGTIPAFELELPPMTLPSSPVTVPTKIRFETLDEAAKSCGESRLFAGVHFSPSVPAGFNLAEGIGEMTRKHVSDLYAGRVPEGCTRCVRQ